MKLNELQICLTNVCRVNCEYCHLDKKFPKHISFSTLKKAVEIAKNNNIEFLRLTGGDVFEHKELEKILSHIKKEGIKTILNISSERIREGLKTENYDILLVSFSSPAKIKDIASLKESKKEVMGCVVFQKEWLAHLKELAKTVDEVNFSSFFFLRDVNNSTFKYFQELNECVERTLQITKKITFANAFPLCFTARKNLPYCAGKKFDNGNERLYITEEGRIKPSAYSEIVLGTVDEVNCLDSLPRNQGRISVVSMLEKLWENSQKTVEKTFNKIEQCKKCKIRDYCGGGIIAGKKYAPDKLREHTFCNKYLTKLQEEIKYLLPESSFDVDLKMTYFRNSDFFMRYIPFNVMKEIKKEDLRGKIHLKNSKLCIYVHFPFCKGFCKFCRIQKLDNKLVNDYLDNLIKDIEENKNIIKNNKIQSIYFGGGCPQLMGKNVKKVFEALFGMIDEVKEINFELFPGFFDKELMEFIRQKVTRVSVGIQCLNDDILKRMGRKSTKKEIISFVREVKKLGFKTNYDVIYGLFINKKEEFENDFREILSLKPDQITLQPLHFANEIDEVIDLKTEIELNSTARSILKEKGFEQVSAEDFSKDKELFIYQQNLLENNNILGLGRGTFSKINRVHFRKKEDGTLIFYEEDKWTRLYGKLFFSTRMLKLDIKNIDKDFGISFKACFSESIKYLLKKGMIEMDVDNIFITEKGKEYVDLVANIISLNNLDYKL